MRLFLAALTPGSLGSGTRLSPFDLRRGWLILLAFAIQTAVVRPITDPSSLGIKRLALAVIALMLLLAILPNLRWWAFRIFAAGFVLNTLVMAANGGLMPVTLENHLRVADASHQTLSLGQTPPRSKVVLLASSDTRLSFLSDTIYLSIPRPKIYSVGDLFLMAGLLTFLVEVAVRAVYSRRRSRTFPVVGGAARTD
jgi:hypothetical protein